MFPVLFKIGPLTLHAYGAMVALGFYLGYRWMLFQGRRHGLSEDQVSALAWTCMLAGLAGARLLYVAFNPGHYLSAPWEIFKIWEGGLVWYGGLLAGAGAGVLWLRRRKISVPLAADVTAPALALAHAVGRLGCFLAGCCYGRECALPWAVTFRHPDTLAPSGIPLHPAQLYEAALDLLLFALLARRPVGSGRTAVLYIGGYSLARLTVEFFRGDERGPVWLSLTSTQWIAVLGLGAALAGWTVLSRRTRA